MNIIIETVRLRIREIKSGDLDSLLEIYRNSQNMAFIPNSDFKWTKEDLKQKYDRINQDYTNGFGIFAIELKNENEIIGEAGLFNSFQNTKHLELGYIIDSRYWKKGYGTEVCKLLINYGFQELKLKKLSARMFKQNTASRKLSEKCGMRLVREGQAGNGAFFCEYEILNHNP